MRVIVCDDEPLAREYLVSIIQAAEYEVIAQVTNGTEAVRAVKIFRPDVIFLDIHMPEMDGVRCAQLLSELEHAPAIIFVSAYDHYAMVAFKVNAIGYLLKPANENEVLSTLSKAKKLNAAQLNEIYACNNSTVYPIREHNNTYSS